MDANEKQRIVKMIGDVDAKHKSKIYEIIKKCQPELPATECDIDVSLPIHRFHLLPVTLQRLRLF